MILAPFAERLAVEPSINTCVNDLDLSRPGIEPRSLTCEVNALPLSHCGVPGSIIAQYQLSLAMHYEISSALLFALRVFGIRSVLIAQYKKTLSDAVTKSDVKMINIYQCLLIMMFR